MTNGEWNNDLRSILSKYKLNVYQYPKDVETFFLILLFSISTGRSTYFIMFHKENKI